MGAVSSELVVVLCRGVESALLVFLGKLFR